ncbi:hypothetical protein POTOM_051188 [Populus tomentosa]|uniref:Uncharacterized protein n=1 Tax=Populus tomentosa TaxID=118781 RepID=A0A8X7Y7Z8_POPTO|nr:hypothetical protein POTOM_051188 [Populus tomentosa]
MATMLKSLSFFVILLIVNSLFFMETTEARPFNTMKSRNSAASRAIESFFDGLSLGEIKQSGPTPGVGNGFTNSLVFDLRGSIFGYWMNRPIIWICRRSTDALADALDEFTGSSEILVEEDGTLAVFPETFEEHKDELQSDIKAEEPWSPTFQLAKGKIILDVGSAVRTQLFCRILESQHGQAGQLPPPHYSDQEAWAPTISSSLQTLCNKKFLSHYHVK